jgi:hypothetical protein
MVLSSTVVSQRLAAKIFHRVMATFERELKRELKRKVVLKPVISKSKVSLVEPNIVETTTVPIVESKQSQHHGFVFENQIRTRVFGMSSEKNDTGKHDIPKDRNTLNSNENVSIKMTKTNGICCADILRFYDYEFSDENTMIIGQYKQNGNQKNITRIVELDYNKNLHQYLFGTASREELSAYVDMVKAIPRGKPSERLRKEILQKKKDIEKTHGMNIQISPKIDSGSQRRVQCMIKNIDDIIRNMPANLRSLSSDGVIRGIKIDTVIASTVRTRNTRHTILTN